MVAEEKLKRNNLYKLFLLVLKIIPMMTAAMYALSTLLSFFYIDIIGLGYFFSVSLLSLIFFYIASYVFRFCAYHRMFLHYIVLNQVINIIDYYIGIPVTNKGLFILHISVIGISLFIILYLRFKGK